MQPAITYGYDALGDITSKSDIGTYSYGGGAGPHAVTSISGPAGGSYSYDADGNMTNRNGTAITWNSDNLPVTITQSGSNSSSFAYAPDKHRYYQSAVINSVTETTVYAGAFEAVTTGGTTTYRYHLSADSREVAEVDLSNSGSSVIEKISYVLSDHLGSTDMIETVDVNGNLLSTTEMSFSAWGGRREPSTWLPPVGSAETASDHNADRYGFTHQEMLDNVGIIHMNGRIYDPNLGRFLSVDPVFEFPTNTQSLNPYSYVLNNPLSMTDPTGYAPTCVTNKDGSTTCTGNIIPTGSHIAQQVSATVSAKGGPVSFSGPLAGPGGHSLMLGSTMMTASVAMGGNGAQSSQTAASAQQQPAQHTDIGSPSQTSQSSSSGGAIRNSAGIESDLYSKETILGKNVGIGIEASIPESEQNGVLKKLDASIGIIDANAIKLSKQDATIIRGINYITVNDNERSGVNPQSGILNLRSSYIENKEVANAFLASVIGHDAYHIYQYQHGEIYNRITAGPMERQADLFQMRVGKIFGLTQYELGYLNRDTHTLFNTPPY